MTDYYTPEAVDTLIGEIYSAEDCVKYLFNLPKDHEDEKLLTPELLEQLSDLNAACQDFNAVYHYYSTKAI